MENNARIIDQSECYRSAIALSVSALDFYVHRIIIEKATEIYQGSRPATTSTRELQVSIIEMMQAPSQAGTGWLGAALQAALKRRTFQKSNDISKGIAYIHSGKIWNEVAVALGETAEGIKARLNIIASKRDIIVHEADIDFSNFPNRNPVSREDADYAVNTIERIVEAMDVTLG